MSAWSHLPNAEHIDRILADLKANPENWDAARYAARGAAHAARSAALNAARSAARSAALNAARSAALNAARNVGWGAAWDAILALVAWDSSADLLAITSDEVRLLAHLGDNRAVLMLPAIIAFEKSVIAA